LEALCAQLCRRHSELSGSTSKYELVKQKYERAKARLKQLGERCDHLTQEIERNRKMLDDHMKSIHRRDRTEISDKLDHLQELLSSQMEQQHSLLEKKTRPKELSAIKRASSVTRVVPEKPPPNVVDDDVKTTDPIKRSRKKSAKTPQKRSATTNRKSSA
jgi:predicted nuclease with TOPRIM domain